MHESCEWCRMHREKFSWTWESRVSSAVRTIKNKFANSVECRASTAVRINWYLWFSHWIFLYLERERYFDGSKFKRNIFNDAIWCELLVVGNSFVRNEHMQRNHFNANSWSYKHLVVVGVLLLQRRAHDCRRFVQFTSKAYACRMSNTITVAVAAATPETQ